MDTPTAEAGHKEGLVVGAGTEAPDDALLHLVIRPGEPLGLMLGGQVPDCGHASCPPLPVSCPPSVSSLSHLLPKNYPPK